MYVGELQFRIVADTSLTDAEAAIRDYLEALIFQGQILGREFPTAQAADHFISRVVLPEKDALAPANHSAAGLQAFEALGRAGLSYPKLQILGPDLMSNHTDPCPSPPAFILYCRFSQMNSVLYCAEHFAPVPLYRLCRSTAGNSDFESLIRWQLQFQALDEIQMQQDSLLQRQAERALQQPHSKLNRQGRQLARQLSRQSGKPVYFALYRGSSPDCQAEEHRHCPYCNGDWRLSAPWHDLFDFRCDRCQVVSNIAWQCQ